MTQENNSLQAALERGQIELEGQFMSGYNYTFLVSIHHEGRRYF